MGRIHTAPRALLYLEQQSGNNLRVYLQTASCDRRDTRTGGVLRIGMTAADIPYTPAQPDQGGDVCHPIHVVAVCGTLCLCQG